MQEAPAPVSGRFALGPALESWPEGMLGLPDGRERPLSARSSTALIARRQGRGAPGDGREGFVDA